jgi:hypothetical protein
MPLAIFRYYETNLMLLNPIETWFATNFVMVERLFKLKLAIEQTIVDPNWTTFINSMHGNHHPKLLTKVRAIQANVRRDEFWDTCVNFVHMVETILVSLRAFDGNQPCMGRNVETLYLPPLLSNAKGGLLETKTYKSFMLENYQSDRIVPNIGRKKWHGNKCDLVNHVMGETIIAR